MQSVEERVIVIVSEELGVPKNSITRNDNLADLEMDSLDEVELLMELEDEFDISIADEVAQMWKTVGDAIDYVSNATF